MNRKGHLSLNIPHKLTYDDRTITIDRCKFYLTSVNPSADIKVPSMCKQTTRVQWTSQLCQLRCQLK